MAKDHGGAVSEPSHLRRHLLAAGAGNGFSYRQLERASGYRVKKDTWSRLVAPIPPGQRGKRWPFKTLTAAAETLRKLGSTVTVSQLERAMLADLGYAQAVSGDDLSEVLARVAGLSHTDQLRLIQEVALMLAPDGAADQPASPRASVPRSDPSRG